MLRRFSWVALIFVMLFATEANSQTRQPPHRDAAHEQREASDNRGTPQQPLVVDVVPAPDAADRAEYERRDREREMVNEGRQLALTVLIAFFTAAQVVIAGAALFTTYTQLRAYALMTDARIFGLSEDRSAEVVYKIKNTGQTPARHVTAAVSYVFEPPDFDDFTLEGDAPRSTGVIGPGEHMTFRFVIPVKEIRARLDKLATEKEILFVFGGYSYRDVFGFEQRGTFRLHYVVVKGVLIDGQMATCEQGNSAT